MCNGNVGDDLKICCRTTKTHTFFNQPPRRLLWNRRNTVRKHTVTRLIDDGLTDICNTGSDVQQSHIGNLLQGRFQWRHGLMKESRDSSWKGGKSGLDMSRCSAWTGNGSHLTLTLMLKRRNNSLELRHTRILYCTTILGLFETCIENHEPRLKITRGTLPSCDRDEGSGKANLKESHTRIHSI